VPLMTGQGRLNHLQLANSLIKMTRPAGGIALAAPMISGGYLRRGLMYSQHLLATRHSRGESQDQREGHLANAMAQMMAKCSIDFIPWKAPQAGHSIPRAATTAYWLHLSESRLPPSQSTSNDEDNPASIAALASRRSPDAPWCIPESLAELPQFFHKTRRPQDWDIKWASLTNSIDPEYKGSYINETYYYVNDRFDIRIWYHHMALLWSICFSQILPNVGYREVASLPSSQSGKEVTASIRRFKWVAPNKEKGIHAPEPFIVMLTTLIIAMIDAESPLRKHLDSNKQSFGVPWTDKHGVLYSSARLSTIDPIFVIAAPKYINAVNLIRMNVAEAIKGTVVKRPALNSNWRMKSEVALKRQYETIIACFSRKPYGVYEALELVLGEQAAREVSRRDSYPCPPE
jgi:hypothetical protein